ncbi:MAG: hypothetical protein DHS20C18_04020 [Saprospiraceae bacterium]|nr:MAG: hypothetical protein DHS20C18_04020 [Saprospiraceae bacterium]
MTENFKINLYTPFDKLTSIQSDKVVQFLYEHLQEYGDERPHIKMAIDYAMKEVSSPGGFVLVGAVEQDILGVVVVNKTGMSGYIPENILVYIAVHEDTRGKGVGKKLMKAAIKNSTGDIALHVEANNPALRLYEKLGFENKYLEMRLHKSDQATQSKGKGKKEPIQATLPTDQNN